MKVSDVKTESDPRHWAIFERQRRIHEHIAENGMINPIVVNSSNQLQFGGCRLQYAVLHGWEDIPAIVIDGVREVAQTQKQMAMLEYTFLPNELIEIEEA